jgi:hypothetical protein
MSCDRTRENDKARTRKKGQRNRRGKRSRFRVTFSEDRNYESRHYVPPTGEGVVELRSGEEAQARQTGNSKVMGELLG